MDYEPKEQIIETTYENEHISMTVKVKDGKLSSMSFNKVDTGKHLFSVKQLENGGLQRANSLLWSTIAMLKEARTIVREFRKMSRS